MNRRCIELGKSIQDKSKPVGRVLMIQIADYLLSNGDLESIEKLNCIITTRKSNGRCGEMATSCWSQAYWEPEQECLVIRQWSFSILSMSPFESK
jgi:hypothetical protein